MNLMNFDYLNDENIDDFRDFYKLLGKYKFMLTLENGLCEVMAKN